MASVPYIDGGNTPRQRDLVSGDGTLANPDVFRSEDPVLQSIATTISGNVIDIESLVTAISGRLPAALISGRFPVDAPVIAPAYSPATPPTLAVAAGVAITSSVGAFFNTAGMRVFRIQIDNTGASALNGFEISTRCHANADMQAHLSSAADFTAPPTNSILRHSGDTLGANVSPTTLAATTGKIILTFDFTNFFAESLRIRASAAPATTLRFFHGGI